MLSSWVAIFHVPECTINHVGSSCAMEQEAALKLWQRSENNGFRYTTLLSDGDAKTYQYLNTKEVYGPEMKIKRIHKPSIQEVLATNQAILNFYPVTRTEPKLLPKLLHPLSELGLAIHQNDHQARRRFVEWAQNEIAVVSDFHKRILFSDEAHFWLNGYVNKQNCRIWSEANPQVYVETPLHPETLTVWCAL
ncbi:uncharacterized protein TNCV_1930521 [Trichonephila clavipes]|nr:uncharacterized protein TNCV_1930521 [Trichonephila clavipes]